MKKTKYILLNILLVLAGTLAAVIIHNLLPSPGADVMDTQMDSIFIKAFGFPAVAFFYFIVIFSYALFAVQHFGKRSGENLVSTGLRYGVSVGLMYITGMEEVVVEASPFKSYGIGFVSYQFWQGIGDALSVLIISAAAGFVFRKNNNVLGSEKSDDPEQSKLNIPGVAAVSGIIGLFIFLFRTTACVSGVLQSDFTQYPVPTLVWNAAFGVVMGIVYCLMRPVFIKLRHYVISDVIFCAGLNWVWFNCFIVLIQADTAVQMLMRGLTDTVILFTGAWTAEKVIRHSVSVKTQQRVSEKMPHRINSD